MTSSLPHNAARRRTRGFTLVEALVVMGIILALISILLPTVNRMQKVATRTRMAADLNLISQALDQYREKFGDYPRPASNLGSTSGAVVLCWSLLAPGPATQDGFDGMGFRPRGTGQGEVYGPYLTPDRLKIGTLSTNKDNLVLAPTSGTTYDDTKTLIGDYYDHVILYFPANLSVPPTTAYVKSYTPGTVPPQATYNFSENSAFNAKPNYLTQKVFAYRVGAHKNPGGNPAIITATDTAVATGPYILWSPGPDGVFGPQIDPTFNTATGEDDDVTYPELDPVPKGFTP